MAVDVNQHSVTGFGEMQVLSQSISQKPATSIAVDVHENSVTGSGEMPVFQLARQASPATVTQSVTSTSVKPMSASSLLVLPLNIQTLTSKVN